MKKIVALIIFVALAVSAFAQTTDDKYKKMWKEVSDAQYKDLPKTALEKVEKIMDMAVADKDDYQQIKAITYKMKFLVEASQDGNLKSIDFLEEQAEKLSGTSKHLCNFLIGASYQNYYSRNRYKIDSRSAVSDSAEKKGSRLEFYDKFQFMKLIIGKYKLAINPELKNVAANDYREFFTDNSTDNDFFPTLYDELLYSAIVQLYKLERGPSANFDDKFFCSAEDFINMEIPDSDEDNEMARLYFLQQLLKENKQGTNAYAFADYKRISYIADKQNGKRDIIMQLYADAAQKYKGNEAVIFINKERAQILSRKSAADQVEAVKLLETTIDEYKDSKYVSYCQNLLARLKFPSISISTDEYIYPDENIPFHIEYSNTKTAKIKVVKLSDKASDYETLSTSNASINKYYTYKSVSESTINLPDTHDYSEHSTYYVEKGLPTGLYIIFAESDTTKVESYTIFKVSRMALLRIDDGKFMVVDRNSGKPIDKAKVKVTTRDYEKTETLLSTETSSDGIFSYDYKKSKYYTMIYLKKDNEDIYFPAQEYYSHTSEKAYERSAIELLTDRSIYRPGQSVFFKAIEYRGKGDNLQVVPNDSIRVNLIDVNNQKIASLTLKTNQYGSVNGEFKIPDNVLTGYFGIDAYGSARSSGHATIEVEEYKRPTFELNMEHITDEVSFGDSVSIKGHAKSYSGVPVSDADVIFTVNCKSYSRYWWSNSSSEKKLLANGIIKTDENGDFTISFVAKQCFSDINLYKIEAVVTDINGEAHTVESSLYISNQSLWISHNISETVELADFKHFNIYTENISGNHIDAIVEYEIFKLEEPSHATISRHKTTDIQMYSREEWEKLCPMLEYGDENSLKNRKIVSSVMKGTVNTADTTPIAIGKKVKFTTGSYRIIMKSKDKDGNEIADTTNFHITDNSSSKMPYPMPSYFTLSQSSAKVGDKVQVKIGSSFDDVTAFYTIQIGKEELNVKSMNLSNEIKTLEIPITEECYGNIFVTVVFVRHGRAFEDDLTISVPRINKQLDVKLVTFRDKTLPGAEESWQMKIADKFGNPVDAELAATVYDASLDSYRWHSWRFWPYSSNSMNNNFAAKGFDISNIDKRFYYYVTRKYEITPYPSPYFFNALNARYSAYTHDYRSGNKLYKANAAYAEVEDEAAVLSETVLCSGMTRKDVLLSDEEYAELDELLEEEAEEAFASADVRTNFNETAYFAADLSTDKDGNVYINFKMPESLTRWNVFGLAHTKDMKIGDISNSIVTQKKVSVTPNLPRFLREGDEIYISAKIANLTENKISGKARIEFISTENSEDITAKFLSSNTVSFTADANRNTSVEWKVSVPMSIGAVSVRIVAVGDGHSDGEEKVLPILTNRMMVTETMPLPVRRAGTTKFSFASMKNNTSNSLENYSYTLEFTPNPAWYAVLALPYMMEYPYECAEQTFSRIYSNLIASHIANSDKKIEEMFNRWKETDAEALNSNLQRNEELKSVLLENSPWLLDAKDEAEDKQNIGVLFDLARIKAETRKATDKLEKMQKGNGGFPWFEGMPDNLYVTQHIVGNYGHLQKLGVKFPDSSMEGMIKKAVKYIDRETERIYELQKKYDAVVLGYTQIHYLYVRSFFLNKYPMDKSTQKVFDAYMKLGERDWQDWGFYMRGMLALAMQRSGRTETVKAIINSLKEYAQHSEELGMYWDLERGWYWYNSGIETQSLLIELFDEVGEDQDVNEMKVWLLKQKQTNRWKTTKATAEAVYALLLDGTSILGETDYPTITLGDKTIDLATEKTEDGTGYYKKAWKKDEMENSWSEVSVTKSDSTVAWGSIYWQYYEDIDKIKGFEDTPLKIRKDLFVNRVENGKEVIVPITQENANLKVGDKVTVRIEIEVDRNMEYVHLKDMRASAFEPTEKLSGYRFKHSLGYYQSIKDASVNFFIDILPKGTYVFEYQVIATQKGNFSNGITTIQSMYAPEYTSHSTGIRVTVE
ncbi:MAG: hypothetical protein J6W06_08325 [Bacteroidales bacterium]|nr:hypothetical protein [Bacteroidales bacterium]